MKVPARRGGEREESYLLLTHEHALRLRPLDLRLLLHCRTVAVWMLGHLARVKEHPNHLLDDEHTVGVLNRQPNQRSLRVLARARVVTLESKHSCRLIFF